MIVSILYTLILMIQHEYVSTTEELDYWCKDDTMCSLLLVRETYRCKPKCAVIQSSKLSAVHVLKIQTVEQVVVCEMMKRD